MKKLIELLPGVKEKVKLAKYTTFQIGGQARYFFEAKNKRDLILAIEAAKKTKTPFFILGGGSNLLFSDKGYKGLIVKIQNSNLEVNGSKITAGAGLTFGKLVRFSAEEGLLGLEWGAGIPGQVGGAVFGNAGAFGGSIADSVKRIEILKTKSSVEFRWIKKEDCKFGYRDSFLKKNKSFIIFSCELQLKKGDKQKIKEKIQEYLNYRKKKHPQQPSAGSVFKNINTKKLNSNFLKKFPEAKKVIKENILPAAYLIDQVGLKGKRIGGVKISELHPNFIINLNGGKAEDVLKLIKLVKEKIRKKFKILLEEEIQILK
ncbi:MAG: UDP-N-acetylmuramate dehydrogenase [Candidatus Nealsonbacteria bacterium]